MRADTEQSEEAYKDGTLKMLLFLPSQLSSFFLYKHTVLPSPLNVAKHSRIELSAAIFNAGHLMKLIGLTH